MSPELLTVLITLAVVVVLSLFALCFVLVRDYFAGPISVDEGPGVQYVPLPDETDRPSYRNEILWALYLYKRDRRTGEQLCASVTYCLHLETENWQLSVSSRHVIDDALLLVGEGLVDSWPGYWQLSAKGNQRFEAELKDTMPAMD